jgi:arsenate reductase
MEKAKFYHNPRCSTSRKTLELVKNSGIPYEIIEYLKTPPSKKELKQILKGLDKHPLEIIRTKDKRFKEMGFSKKDVKEPEEWLKILLENPALMERPIVVYKKRFEMGRPPEKVLEILK